MVSCSSQLARSLRSAISICDRKGFIFTGLFIMYFCGAGAQAQGLVLARPALYLRLPPATLLDEFLLVVKNKVSAEYDYISNNWEYFFYFK